MSKNMARYSEVVGEIFEVYKFMLTKSEEALNSRENIWVQVEAETLFKTASDIVLNEESNHQLNGINEAIREDN